MQRLSQHLTIGLLLLASAIPTSVFSQTLWTGPKIFFEKQDSVDWTLPENQDRITGTVWITRANNQGIFNIFSETEFDRVNRTSPANTEWANGSIADGIQNLEFKPWQKTILTQTGGQVDTPKVLHIISEDIYIDIVFRSWTHGGGGSGTGMGGGFSYERSTPTPTGTKTLALESEILFYPNPVVDYLTLENPGIDPIVYTLSNSIGTIYATGILTQASTTIDCSGIPTGLIIVRLNNGQHIKLLKR